MKSRAFTIIIAAAGVALLSFLAPVSSGQYPAGGSLLSPQAAAMIKELKEQNAQLVAQQAAIEAQIEEIGEAIRQARILAARSGGKGGTP